MSFLFYDILKAGVIYLSITTLKLLYDLNSRKTHNFYAVFIFTIFT